LEILTNRVKSFPDVPGNEVDTLMMLQCFFNDVQDLHQLAISSSSRQKAVLIGLEYLVAHDGCFNAGQDH
jgi:hypothetical protein